MNKVLAWFGRTLIFRPNAKPIPECDGCFQLDTIILFAAKREERKGNDISFRV